MPENPQISCIVFRDLVRVLDSANTAYRVALASPYFLVSTEIAARRRVDLERSKSALNEHLSSCRSDLPVDERFVLPLSD
jgi:hypothetical protein